MIKMVVTISTNHLSTSDYEGIVKVVKQIPPMYFELKTQAAGSDKASVVRPAAATTQSNLPKPRNSSTKTSYSSSAHEPSQKTSDLWSVTACWDT